LIEILAKRAELQATETTTTTAEKKEGSCLKCYKNINKGYASGIGGSPRTSGAYKREVGENNQFVHDDGM